MLICKMVGVPSRVLSSVDHTLGLLGSRVELPLLHSTAYIYTKREKRIISNVYNFLKGFLRNYCVWTTTPAIESVLSFHMGSHHFLLRVMVSAMSREAHWLDFSDILKLKLWNHYVQTRSCVIMNPAKASAIYASSSLQGFYLLCYVSVLNAVNMVSALLR